MKTIVFISRIIVGLVFTFSGFVKAIDPIGTQIKFSDYFDAMGLDWLKPASLFFSFLMNSAELVTGLMLLLNVLPKISTLIALLFMLLFTPVTLWLAVANPVSDCGCFGDAIKLTNWQTFGKNLIILVFVILAFLYRKKIKIYFENGLSYIITLVFVLLAFGFQAHNLRNLPVIDFRPYKIGVNILEKSSIPKDAQKAEYATEFIYTNTQTGKDQKFTLENFPADEDSTWEFKETINTLIKEGYVPPIHDFTISDKDGNDITKEILSNPNYSFILVSYELESGNFKNIDKIKGLANYCKSEDLKFYCFTASSDELIQEYSKKLPSNIEFCGADKKMQKTLIRSNPGLVILKSGTIIDKFAHKNIPSVEDLKDILK